MKTENVDNTEMDIEEDDKREQQQVVNQTPTSIESLPVPEQLMVEELSVTQSNIPLSVRMIRTRYS